MGREGGPSRDNMTGEKNRLQLLLNNCKSTRWLISWWHQPFTQPTYWGRNMGQQAMTSHIGASHCMVLLPSEGESQPIAPGYITKWSHPRSPVDQESQAWKLSLPHSGSNLKLELTEQDSSRGPSCIGQGWTVEKTLPFPVVQVPDWLAWAVAKVSLHGPLVLPWNWGESFHFACTLLGTCQNSQSVSGLSQSTKVNVHPSTSPVQVQWQCPTSNQRMCSHIR